MKKAYSTHCVSVYSCLSRLEIRSNGGTLHRVKGKPGESRGRKATGPRFLRDAFRCATKDPKIAGLQVIPDLHRESAYLEVRK